MISRFESSMKTVILEKVSKEIDQGIDSEAKTLYLLAQIRKYLEHSGRSMKSKYKSLAFFSDWVLHAKMTFVPTKVRLEKFDDLLRGYKDIKDMSHIFIKEEKNFYQLISLREDLLLFLSENGLPTSLVDNKARWWRFQKLLVEILIDIPLLNEKGFVNMFSFERGRDSQIKFRVVVQGHGSFKITLKEK
jgi:hypothetical protein